MAMSRAPATWLIIEPTFVGHHFTYLLEVVRGALKRNIHVIVGVGNDWQGDKIVDRLGASIPAETISFVRARVPENRVWSPGTLGLIQGALRWREFLYRTYRAATKNNRIDFVFVPYLDTALFAISVLGSPFSDTAFAGLTMRQRFHLRELGVNVATARGTWMKRRLFLRLLRVKGLKRVFVIDDTLETYVRLKHRPLAGKLHFVPDPSAPPVVTSKEVARVALGLPGSAWIVLVFGYIDSRKGVSRLLQWVGSCAVGPSAHVLLAGTLSKDIERLLTGEPARSLLLQKRLWVMNRYIDLDEEQLVYSAVDVVWLGYEQVELMSGVLVKAAQFRKVVLFADYGLIGRYSTRYGSTGNSASPEAAVISKLPEGIEMRSFAQRVSVSDPLPDHSWENACRAIFDCSGSDRQPDRQLE